MPGRHLVQIQVFAGDVLVTDTKEDFGGLGERPSSGERLGREAGMRVEEGGGHRWG